MRSILRRTSPASICPHASAGLPGIVRLKCQPEEFVTCMPLNSRVCAYSSCVDAKFGSPHYKCPTGKLPELQPDPTSACDLTRNTHVRPLCETEKLRRKNQKQKIHDRSELVPGFPALPSSHLLSAHACKCEIAFARASAVPDGSSVGAREQQNA